MSGTPGVDGPADSETGSPTHDRRFRILAVTFGAVVLILAALSIAVVILASQP